MSYDLYLDIDTGGAEPARVSDHWNYTSNVSKMWALAMPETHGLAGTHGMLASDAAVHLRAGIAAMEADRERFQALNPPNGWGDFESQLAALREWLGELDRHPKATVGVSR